MMNRGAGGQNTGNCSSYFTHATIFLIKYYYRDYKQEVIL